MRQVGSGLPALQYFIIVYVAIALRNFGSATHERGVNSYKDSKSNIKHRPIFFLGEVEIQKFEFNDAQDKQKLVILQCKKFIDFF